MKKQNKTKTNKQNLNFWKILRFKYYYSKVLSRGEQLFKRFCPEEANFRLKKHLAVIWFRSEWVKHHAVQPQYNKICVRFITFDHLILKLR